MLFLLLPFIFNPFGFLIRWLPALYLAAWPIIIQTLGRDALMLQAILLIVFILTCDITREIMLKLVGFDLISLPMGILLLALLLTDKGSSLLSFITPLCSTLLVVIEPIFLLVESLMIMEMIKSFNKWMSSLSNIRDDNQNDLSSWEPPLSRGSLVMRFLIILISIASYACAYMLVQETRTLLGVNDSETPVQFNHAISLLVTLQLIALTATIYKEEGILSESAIVGLIATVPIFIAAWSFNHLKAEADSRHPPLAYPPALPKWLHKLDLSMEKLTEYYFGPDFWYILGARLLCLVWWLVWSPKGARPTPTPTASTDDRIGSALDNDDESCLQAIRRKWHRFNSWLPVSKRTLIKVLFVLAYAQMLVQQMENKQSLMNHSTPGSYEFLLYDSQQGSQDTMASSCCGASNELRAGSHLLESSANWLNCMWNCARACSQAATRQADEANTLLGHKHPGASRATRFMEALLSFFGQLVAFFVGLSSYAYNRLTSLNTALYSIYALWLVKWGSPIIQRLMQSIFIQLYYISSLALTNDDDDDDDDEEALANNDFL